MGLDPAAAEDAVQETFFVVLRKRSSFRPGSSFDAWAFKILERVVHAERRRRERQFAALRLASSDVRESDERNAAIAPELGDEIERSIKALPSSQRDVVSDVLIEGRSVGEVADRMRVSKNVVSVRLHRGLRQIRDHLGVGAAVAIATRLAYGTRGIEHAWSRTSDAWTQRASEAVAPSGVGVGVGVAVGASVLAAAIVAGVWSTRGPADRPNAPASNTLAPPGAEAVGTTEPQVATSLPDGARSSVRTDARVDEADVEPTSASTVSAPLTGRVFDPRGRPAPAGVEVFLLESTPDVVLPTAPLEPAAVTDADGTFEIPRAAEIDDPTPIVVARAPGLVAWADCDDLDGERRIPDLNLAPDVAIAVTAVDETGLPIEGVHVAAFVEGARFTLPYGDRSSKDGAFAIRAYQHLNGAVTDAKGRALIGGLVRGAGSPSIVVCGAWAPGRFSAESSFQSVAGDRLECEFVMPATAGKELRGTVTDKRARPIAGTSVHVGAISRATNPDTLVATTDDAGAWSVPWTAFEDLPRRISFEADGYVTRFVDIREPAEIPSGEPRFALVRATSITGRVVEANGEPVGGATVSVRGSGLALSCKTAADGAFEIPEAPGGPGVVTVETAAGARSLRRAVVDVSESITIEFPAAAPRVSSLVVSFEWDEGGGDHGLDRAILVPREAADVAMARPLDVGSGNVASVSDLPRGEWVLFARDSGGRCCVESIDLRDSSEPEVAVRARFRATTSLDLNVTFPAELVHRGGRISARLAHRAEHPIWLVDGASGSPIVQQRRFDDGGDVRLTGMHPGTWEVAFVGRDWCSLPIEVEVAATGPTHVEVDAIPAAFVEVLLPCLGVHGLCHFELRRPGERDWRFWSYLMNQADGLRSNLVRVPPGAWEWRATQRAYSGTGGHVPLYPDVVSSFEIEAGERLMLDARGRSDWLGWGGEPLGASSKTNSR